MLYNRVAVPKQQLVKQVQNAINGEYTAIKCYEKLAKMAPTEQEREQIMEIRGDEIHHFRQFSNLYSGLTGQDVKPKQVAVCPDTYKKGLNFAFHDEQKTVGYYHKVADETLNPTAKVIFNRAAKDEQNHAVWFLYYLTR